MSVDVLLPFRGDDRLMQQAVESVRAQTHADWVLHVLDDANAASRVPQWLDSLADPRIRVHRSEVQLGVNRAFRRCLDLGDAALVTFMGCDDLMHPTHLEHVLDLADRHPGTSVVQPGVRVIDAAGRPTRPVGDRIKSLISPGPGTHVLQGEPLARSLMHGNWLYFPSLLWRRAALEAHPLRPGLDTALDLRLVMDLVLDGHSLVTSDRVTFDYRRHAASASSVTARTATRFDEELLVSREVAAECSALGWDTASRSATLHLTSRLNSVLHAASSLRHGQLPTARRILRAALAR